MTDEIWTVYVISNPAGVLYTGIAKGDPARRLEEHNTAKGAKFTKGRGPWEIVHNEGPMGHGDALRREMAIKADRAFKQSLKGN